MHRKIHQYSTTVGYVEYIDDENTNGTKITIGFKPDYIIDDRYFDQLAVSRKYLETGTDMMFNHDVIKFDYAYALTVHSAQGSQYNRVLYIDDGFSGDREIKKKLKYTAITRAIDSIDIVDSGCFYTTPLNA